MKMNLAIGAIICGFAVAGCANYTWRSQVPEDMRTVSVPVFRNESNVTGLGSAVTRQVLREFEREGTFAIKSAGDSALEIQGIIESSDTKVVAYDRQTGARNRERKFDAVAKVSVIDKRAGKVLVNNRKYRATTTFISGNDVITGEADATGRLAEEFARQIVDDVVSLNWKGRSGKSKAIEPAQEDPEEQPIPKAEELPVTEPVEVVAPVQSEEPVVAAQEAPSQESEAANE